MHTVRFVVGMSLLAGGAVLAQPLARALLAVRRPPADASPTGQPAWRLDGPPLAAPPPGGHAIPDPLEQRQAGGGPLPVVMMPPTGFAAGAPGAGQGGMPWPDAAGPVPAPTPLPASSLHATPATPELAGTYRSTVDIPPPPLLDAQSPPPLSVGWSAHVAPPAAAPFGAAPFGAGPLAAAAPAVAPIDGPMASYVVRDGDDLTSIALAAYGHAGAAAAILAANADRLPDPGLLPIGLTLRLPPSWTLPASAAVAAGGPPAIEPSLATSAPDMRRPPAPAVPPSAAEAPAARVDAGTAAAAARGQHWLEPSGGTVVTPAALPRSAPAAVRPGSVRVAVGESLEMIALRFYGDRAMSQRIWQANRDRLRSPDLIVPGMELALP